MGDVHAMREALATAKPPEHKPPMTLIFAGNLARAHDIAHERKLRKGEWRYVTRLEDLRGRAPESCLVLVAASAYPVAPLEAAIRRAGLPHEYVGNH